MKKIFIINLVMCFFAIINVSAKNNNIDANEVAITYTVKNGDCLSKIASQFNLSTKEIYRMNKESIKNANLIHVGQVIIVGYEKNTVNTSVIESNDSNKQTSSSTEELVINKPYFSNQVIAKIYFNYSEVEYDDVELSEAEKPFIDRLIDLGFKANADKKLYSINEIEQSLNNRIKYSTTESFTISANNVIIKKGDYSKLLWLLYSGGQELYPGQDPALILKAEQLGILYNVPYGQEYSYTEIVSSMYNSQGAKKVIYSQGKRFKMAEKNKIYLDCSAFAVFVTNCYGLGITGKTTATIFSRKNRKSLQLIKALSANLKPGDLLGRPNDHVIVYLGQGQFAHSSGKNNRSLWLTTEDVNRRIKQKGGLYKLSPEINLNVSNTTQNGYAVLFK